MPFPYSLAEWAAAYEFGERAGTGESEKMMSSEQAAHCSSAQQERPLMKSQQQLAAATRQCCLLEPSTKKALCSFWEAARAHQIIQHRLLVTKSLVWFLLLDTQCSASALQVCLTDLRVIPFSPSQPELESSQSGHIFHQKAQTILCYLENAKPAKPQTKWIIPKHISRWIMMNESQNTYKEISIFKRNP